jgi:hypothetical protein
MERDSESSEKAYYKARPKVTCEISTLFEIQSPIAWNAGNETTI